MKDNLEFNMLSHWKPVLLMENWIEAVVLPSARHQMNGTMLE